MNASDIDKVPAPFFTHAGQKFFNAIGLNPVFVLLILQV